MMKDATDDETKAEKKKRNEDVEVAERNEKIQGLTE